MNKTDTIGLSNMLPVSSNFIERRIYQIRNQQVMLDSDLAELYQVKTKNLNKSIKRNLVRFPEGFMFQLTKEEFKNLRFQIGTSNKGGRRYLPYAFTDYGVVMLSSILNSYRAIQMNITIVKAFVQIRLMLEEYKGLSKEVAKMKGVQNLHTKVLVKVLNNLKRISSPNTNAIGFRTK